MQPTKWIIITGTSSCGKTSVINALSFEGQTTRPEAARLYIDEKISEGMTLEKIRTDEYQFQIDVLRLKVGAEAQADPSQRIFWDRSVVDTVGFMRVHGFDDTPSIAPSKLFRYEKVFLFEPTRLFNRDYARIESETKSHEIQNYLEKGYRDFGYDVIKVPLMSISERVAFIKRHISQD